MEERFSRTELLIGTENSNRLKNKKVAIFGVGGVGGYVAEALVRAGVGGFLLVDKDVVSVSNINRQIIATTSTVGKSKVVVMKERMEDINPDVKVEIKQCFFLPNNEDEFDFSQYDFIVDAVDTITAKISIIMKAERENVPIISSMGAGNKLDPTKFVLTDIYKTTMCPLAKVMRRELKKRGIKKLPVVFSTEAAVELQETIHDEETNKVTPGSISFVPSVAGLYIASYVVNDIISKN